MAGEGKAMAATMRNLATAIGNGAVRCGAVKFLDRVRQKVPVEMLQNILRTAQSAGLSGWAGATACRRPGLGAVRPRPWRRSGRGTRTHSEAPRSRRKVAPMASAPRAPRPARPPSPGLVQQGFDAAKTGSRLPGGVRTRPAGHTLTTSGRPPTTGAAARSGLGGRAGLGTRGDGVSRAPAFGVCSRAEP